MASAASSALPYEVIVDFRYKHERYITLGCSNKLHTIKLSSLTGFADTKNGFCLEASSKSEFTVSQKLPTAIQGIVPLPKIDLIIAYGEKYLAVFSISKLIVGGRLCLANILQLPSIIVSVHVISFNKVCVLFGSGLIQEVRCGVAKNIEFRPQSSHRFASDFSVKSLSSEDGKYIAYSEYEHTLSTVVFSNIGPEITMLAKFNTILKRYSLVKFRLINDRYLFVLDSLGILTIHDCALDKRLFIERICITSFDVFGKENEILVLLGDATGYLHLYAVMLNPLQLLFKEWKFWISNARISALRVFPSDEGSILLSGDSMGHLASIRLPNLRKFNNTAPKTILAIPTKWNAISIYSIRKIPTALKKITECLLLDKKSCLSTFGITEGNEFVLKDKKADGMRKMRKTIFKSFTCVIAHGEKLAHIRTIDHKTQLTTDSMSFDSEDNILGCFYLDSSTYALQTSSSLVLNTIVRTGPVADKPRTTSCISRNKYLTDDIIFSQIITTQIRNSQKSRVLLGISCEKQQKWTSSIYGCLMPNPTGTMNDNCGNLEIKLLIKLPGRVVDSNSYADGEVYVLLAAPRMLIRFDILYTEAAPNVHLIATGRWSFSAIFGKVYRLLPCPGDSNDIIVTGTKQFCTARGQTEASLIESLKGPSYKCRRRHETEVIAWQVHDWREWGRSVLPSGTKSWDVDMDFDSTSLRINTISSKNEDGRHEFKYEQFRRPEMIQCSAPASFGSTTKMKVLRTDDNKCPLRGAAICILSGDHQGVVSVLALVERIWMIKASFHVQGAVTALDVVFHSNFGFTVACGSAKSSDPTFFSILISDLVKGNVRFYNRNEYSSFVGSYQGARIETVHLISSDARCKDSFPAFALTSCSDYQSGVFALVPIHESSPLSDMSISWRGKSLGVFKKTKRLITMFCSLYNKNTELTQFLILVDTGVLRLTNGSRFPLLDDDDHDDHNPSVKDKVWDAGMLSMKSQMFWLPCSPHTYSIVTGGFDGTVASYFYCDDKQKCMYGAVDRIHTDSVVDTFCAIDSFDGKHLLIFSLDSAGVVVYRKLKLTASRIISQSKPIRICTAVKKATGLAYIPSERRIMVVGEGFELIPL